MKKEVLAFIFDGYADWEPAYVCAELNAGDTEYCVRTISLDKDPKTSMGGFRVIPDYSVDNFPKNYDLLILAGGLAWLNKKNDAVLPVVEYAVSHHIPVGAICNAVNFLAEHGFLDTIKHSGNTLEFVKSQAPHYHGDPNYLEQQAVSDHLIITANGTGTLEFAKEILLLLKAKPEQEVDAWYRQNKSGFYQ